MTSEYKQYLMALKRIAQMEKNGVHDYIPTDIIIKFESSKNRISNC